MKIRPGVLDRSSKIKNNILSYTVLIIYKNNIPLEAEDLNNKKRQQIHWNRETLIEKDSRIS